MNHYQSCIAKKESIKTKKLNESSYGIVKRLLLKYRPSEGLINMHGGKGESKKQMAA